MIRKFPYVLLCALLFLAPVVPILAQDSATMSAPVVKTAEGEVVLMTRVKDFVSGSKYRLGIGGVGASAPDATLELKLGENILSYPSSDFTQGYTSHWWGVDELKAKGFLLTASELPEQGQELAFRVAIPRENADTYDKLYIFVARDYGSETWYLEDGVELDDSYW